MDKKPSNKWTVKQLQAFIRKETNEANMRIREVRESKKSSPVFDKTVNMLRRIGTEKKTLKKGKISSGAKGELPLGLKGKRKSELLVQARALESFKQVDVYSETALKERDKRAEKAYNTFTRNYGFMERDDYENLVNIFASSKEGFGIFYKSLEGQGILDIYNEASQSDKINLSGYMEDIVKSTKGVQGLTPADYTNMLREKIGVL